MTLSRLRRQIDRIDLRILNLLNRRARVALRVGQVKKGRGLPVFDGRREMAVLDRLIKSNSGPLPKESIREIFARILSHSRWIQISRK